MAIVMARIFFIVSSFRSYGDEGNRRYIETKRKKRNKEKRDTKKEKREKRRRKKAKRYLRRRD